MELDFILKAVRRFLPVVALSVVLGVVASQFVERDSAPRYESTALLHVRPPGSSGTADDRYVTSQLVVFESPPIEARAAELIAERTDGAGVGQGGVFFRQLAGTDIVQVIGSALSPSAAEVISNAYLDAYVERIVQADSAQDELTPEEIDRRLEEVSTQLDEVSARIEEALAPFVAAADEGDDIPSVELIDPALAAERDVLLGQYRAFLDQRTALEFGPESADPTVVVQRAEAATTPVPESSNIMLTLAVPVAVVALGIALATFLARSSRKIIDTAEASELLGVPFAGSAPRERSLRVGALDHVDQLPTRMRDTVNELCVQAESRGRLDEPLTVLVTGSRRTAGTTTMAASMAARFGQIGSRVVLVDLDFDRPDISDHYGVEGDGFSLLTRPDSSHVTDALIPTSLVNVSVVGRTAGLDGARPQRSELVMALDRLSQVADVIVFDAGPMLATSAAAVLAHHSHAIVLTVPVWTQERSSLGVVGRQLDPVKQHVMPVSMPRLQKSGARRSSSPVVGSAADGETEALSQTTG